MWRISIDPDACLGSGLCAASAPGHFASVAGRGRPITEVAQPDEGLELVAGLCPAAAITLTHVKRGHAAIAAGKAASPDNDKDPTL
jgi:ferredoxin